MQQVRFPSSFGHTSAVPLPVAALKSNAYLLVLLANTRLKRQVADNGKKIKISFLFIFPVISDSRL